MARRLISNAEVLDDMLKDPEFREEWERTALARAVAEAVTGGIERQTARSGTQLDSLGHDQQTAKR